MGTDSTIYAAPSPSLDRVRTLAFDQLRHVLEVDEADAVGPQLARDLQRAADDATVSFATWLGTWWALRVAAEGEGGEEEDRVCRAMEKVLEAIERMRGVVRAG